MANSTKASKNRTVIKLDDKFVEIKKTKKGLVATELKDDDLFEISMLEDGLNKALQNDMNQWANEAYDELKAGFKNNLRTTVLSIMGFESRWNNSYEVDHCNGRQSMMTEYLSGKVKDMIREEIDVNFTKDDLAPMLPDIKKALLKDAGSLFKREAEELMREQVRESAKEFIGGVLKQQLAKTQKQLIKEASTKLFGANTDDDVIDVGED